MKAINHKLINNLLDAIFPLPECFGVICTDDGDELVNDFCIRNAIKRVDPKAVCTYGMSKLVIMSPNLGDYVIKIPFNGYYSQTYYEDGDNEELEWMDFYEAPTIDSWDYCYSEYEKLVDLRKVHLDSFVADTLFYREIDGIKIFLQEKIYLIDKDPKAKSLHLAKRWKNEKYYSMNLKWIAKCIDCYGENKTKKFLEYCENVDEDILSDTHGGNYGYRKNGTPALLDYSGFYC